MNEIKTEEEFKKELLRCTKYMTSKGSEEVIMELGKVDIKLQLILNKPKGDKE